MSHGAFCEYLYIRGCHPRTQYSQLCTDTCIHVQLTVHIFIHHSHNTRIHEPGIAAWLATKFTPSCSYTCMRRPAASSFMAVSPIRCTVCLSICRCMAQQARQIILTPVTPVCVTDCRRQFRAPTMGLLHSASFRKSFSRSSQKSFTSVSSAASTAESLTAEELDLLKQNSKLASEARPKPHASLTPRGLVSQPGSWLVRLQSSATALCIPTPAHQSYQRPVIPTNFSSARPFPLQAEALKREVDALKSVLRSRGLQAQEGANAISLSPNSTMDELQQLGSPAASDGSFLPGCFMTHGQPEGSPSSTRPSGSTPHRQAFPAASQQRPPQVKVGAFARVMSFRRTKPSPRVSPA